MLMAGEAASEPSGFVRLAAPPEMSGKLTSALGAFVRKYPKIQVDVVTTARGAELVGAGVDLAIVLGRLEDSALMVRRLGTTVYRLYASSAYLERHGHPRSIADLSHHEAVLHRGNQGRTTWELTGPSGTESVEVHGALSGDSFAFVMQGIAAGHGIGLLPEQCLLAQESGADPIVLVLPELSTQGSVQSLVYASQHLPKRVKLLRDYLAEEVHVGCTRGEETRVRSAAVRK
jgi:DNA-binding transcriptional LysR family regulator